MDKKPTEAELEILQILWKYGPSTVRFVNEKLNKKRKEKDQVGYTTTLKVMQLMFEKNLLRRDETERTHVYEAYISEESAQQSLLDKLMDSMFGGSAAKLVLQALGNKKTSKAELQQIKEMIEKMEKGGEV